MTQLTASQNPYMYGEHVSLGPPNHRYSQWPERQLLGRQLLDYVTCCSWLFKQNLQKSACAVLLTTPRNLIQVDACLVGSWDKYLANNGSAVSNLPKALIFMYIQHCCHQLIAINLKGRGFCRWLSPSHSNFYPCAHVIFRNKFTENIFFILVPSIHNVCKDQMY